MNLFNKKVLTLLLGAGSLGTLPFAILEWGPLLLSESNGSSNSPKKEVWHVDSTLQPRMTDAEFDSLEREWDENFRTSDLDGENPTQYGRRKQKEAKSYQSQPAPKGKRVGCICMDGFEQDQRSTGACRGHGGVRYWLHQDSTGKELMRHPTRRHHEHPEPLNIDELGNLSYHIQEELNAGLEAPSRYQGRSPNWRFYDFMSVVFICITVAFITTVIFNSRSQHPER